MSEEEKRLREWIGQHTDSPNGHTLLELLLSEHRATLSRARADALEEAAQYAGLRVYDGWHEAKNNHASPREALAQYVMDSVRTRITTPAPATIPVERVREVLSGLCSEAKAHMTRYFGKGQPGSAPHDMYMVANGGHGAVSEAAQRLGVDIDAGGETGTELGMRIVASGPDLMRQAQGSYPHPVRGMSGPMGCCPLFGTDHDACRHVAQEGPTDARQTCTCAGSCKGADGLGTNWRCALDPKP